MEMGCIYTDSFYSFRRRFPRKHLGGVSEKKKISVAKNQPKRVATINIIDRDTHNPHTLR